MRSIIYVLQFSGNAVPAESGLKISGTARSLVVRTMLAADGVTSSLESGEDGCATFESQVTFTGQGTFQEAGTIRFGEGPHRLRFSTVGQGTIGPTADPAVQNGAVLWQVETGEGQFAGATGFITSNFLVRNGAEVQDNQLAVLLLP